MRKILALLLILIVCKNVSYAYQDDSLDYKSQIKKYITEVVFATMETCVETSTNKSSITNEKSGMKLFDMEYNHKSDWTYQELSDFLKNNNWKKLSLHLPEMWEVQLIVNNIISKVDFDKILNKKVEYPACFTKNSDTESMFTQKVDVIKAKYVQNNSVMVESDVSFSLSVNQINENEYCQDSSSLNWLHFLLLFLTIGVSVASCFIFKAKEKYKNEYCEFKNKYDKFKIQFAKSEKEIRSLKAKFQLVNDEGQVMVLSNSIKKDTHASLEKNKLAVEELNSSRYIKEKIPQFKSLKMFFEDFSDGMFDVRDGKKQKSAWSVFCITKISETEACLDLLYKEMAKEIITDKQTYLIDSICEVNYKEGGNMNKIISAQSGKVVLDGSEWKVVKKIKVVIN